MFSLHCLERGLIKYRHLYGIHWHSLYLHERCAGTGHVRTSWQITTNVWPFIILPNFTHQTTVSLNFGLTQSAFRRSFNNNVIQTQEEYILTIAVAQYFTCPFCYLPLIALENPVVSSLLYNGGTVIDNMLYKYFYDCSWNGRRTQIKHEHDITILCFLTQ